MGLVATAVRKVSGFFLRLPRPGGISPATPISRVLVVGKFPNPTFDYYFRARLAAPGMPPFETIDIRGFNPETDARGAFIIIVRYTSFAISRWLKKNRNLLAGIAVFVDDDIAAAISSPQASLKYRYRLLRESILPLRLLSGLIDELWVSTEVLSRRLSYATPRLMGPAPAMPHVPFAAKNCPLTAPPSIKIAYHATAIHVEEHIFLIPIIKSILEARPSTLFEVVATGKSARLWLELGSERVTVRAPLPWHRYICSQVEPIDIMVVPVAPSHLNDCRADTKRIDVARVKAAAVLSDCAALRPPERGEMILPYERTAWIDCLIKLIDDAEMREVAAAATLQRVQKMSQLADNGILPIKERAAISKSSVC